MFEDLNLTESAGAAKSENIILLYTMLIYYVANMIDYLTESEKY